YDFKPDQIFFFSPDRSMGTGVYIHLMGMQGAGTIPILAQGPVIIPGVSENQELILENREVVAVDLLIVAQRGYPPITVTSPTSIVRPDSVEIQSQTILPHTVSALQYYAFDHLHIGRFALLMFAVMENSAGPQRFDITAVTLGGINALNLTNIERALGNTNINVSSWWVDVSMNQIANVVCTINPNPAHNYNIFGQVMSFQEGIRSGNVTTNSFGGAGGFTMDVTGDNPGSRVFSLGADWHIGGGPMIETTGAPPWYYEHVGDNTYMM
ncbi:unnamed protein product, partial [marine sediment metagenome]